MLKAITYLHPGNEHSTFNSNALKKGGVGVYTVINNNVRQANCWRNQGILTYTPFVLCEEILLLSSHLWLHIRGCRGHDRIVVGFTTTCAISAYHH